MLDKSFNPSETEQRLYAGWESSGAFAADPASDAAPFNVQNVLGLVIWLEGDLSSSITTLTPDGGGTAGVTSWTDQTTHHNDAKGALQFLGRNPTVKANAINALSAIHFNKTGGNVNTGNMLTINENADGSLDWGTNDFYVAVVGDFDNNPSDPSTEAVGNFFSKASIGGTSVAGTSLYGNIPGSTATTGMIFYTAAAAGDFVSTATAYNNSTAHLFAIRRQGGKLDLFVDGTSVANASPTPVDQNNKQAIRIGADGDASSVRLDGDIGEIIAVKDVLTSSDESGIEAYLKKKWATP